MPTPVIVVTGDAVITADGQSYRQSGPGPQTLEVNGSGNTPEFAEIGSGDLWLRRQGDDLRIDVRDSSQNVVLDDWFAAAHHELAVIRTADGGVLQNDEVGALVTAMAGSNPSTT